jgi:hypothetical protein
MGVVSAWQAALQVLVTIPSLRNCLSGLERSHLDEWEICGEAGLRAEPQAAGLKNLRANETCISGLERSDNKKAPRISAGLYERFGA